MDYKGNLYNWNITDHYGWAVNLQDLRDIRLGKILNENSDVDDRFLFNIGLHDKDDSREMSTATFYPKDKIFKISSFDPYGTNLSGILVKFKAESIQQCENILQFILEPNNLEVFNKYKIK